MDNSALDYIIPPASKELGNLYDYLEEEDKIAADLLYEVYSELQKRLELSKEEMDALTRLLNSLDHGVNMDPAGHRNMLAKAANDLGLETPLMF